MGAHASWIVWVVVAGATAAAFFDVTVRRIPNWLPAAILVAAGIYHAGNGAVDLLEPAGVAVVLLVFGTYAHSRAWLGGGDVKLAVALGAAFGFPGAANFLLYTLVSGGALALAAVIIAERRRLGVAATSFAMVFAGGSLPRMTGTSLKVPYAVALACGAALAACANVVPALRLFA